MTYEWRLTWEMRIAGHDWTPTERVHAEADLRDQADALRQFQAEGEDIRNVELWRRPVLAWEKVE